MTITKLPLPLMLLVVGGAILTVPPVAVPRLAFATALTAMAARVPGSDWCGDCFQSNCASGDHRFVENDVDGNDRASHEGSHSCQGGFCSIEHEASAGCPGLEALALGLSAQTILAETQHLKTRLDVDRLLAKGKGRIVYNEKRGAVQVYACGPAGSTVVMQSIPVSLQ